ncbi:MAG TPA: xylulokinase [Afifellaceae bacterium]|nr:xylulokinase [Afifellaceae bacterium]
MSYLGIDIGTSAVKAVLADDRQQVVADATVPLAISRPEPLWSEQDPADWIAAVEKSVDAIREAAPDAFSALKAIGLSGQMHGAVCLDASGRPVRPAILWNDGRSHGECAELLERLPDVGMIAGVLPMPGFTAPKLMWLAAHEPEHFRQVRSVLLPKDHVRLWLTGEAASDMSDAAGTLWLDEAARDWSDTVLAATGMTRAQMPLLREGSEPAGELRGELAAQWGLGGGIVVAAGGGDAAAGGVGIGAVEDGDSFLSLGTSGQLFVTKSAYRPSPETMVHAFAHAVPERWFQMAAMLNGASPLAWFATIVGRDPGDLLGELDGEPVPGRGPLFLPYLAGERTPLNDPHATGLFFGLTGATDRTAMTRAVMEGCTLSFADCLDCVERAGSRIDRLAAIGGGARSDLGLQMLADALNVRVERYAGAETGPAFGAARLARMAATGEGTADVCTKPDVEIAFEPDAGRHAAWQERLVTFRSLYRAVRELRI